MADPKSEANGTANGHAPPRSRAVVEMRVVSKAGARVVEREVVLSKKAASRLEIKGSVPPREREREREHKAG